MPQRIFPSAQNAPGRIWVVKGEGPFPEFVLMNLPFARVRLYPLRREEARDGEVGREHITCWQATIPYLVALSLAIAVLGGYTGLGLAGRILGKTDLQRRALLVGAAGFLSTGIWTMHFIGMLAAPLPADVAYLVLPTIVSFLICALVVGISIFFVVGSRPGTFGTGLAALLLGVGICPCIMSASMGWPDISPSSTTRGRRSCPW